MADKDLKAMYRTRTEGDFPETIEVLGKAYEKVEDLRYGTNPHQPAAYYRPADKRQLVLGAYEVLKTGKGGLSQTNLEDMHHAVGILKYLDRPACAVMKHCNPSGVAMQVNDMPLVDVYRRGRDADAQAAFGSVVVFNTEVDADTAAEIMQTIVEGVAAPAYTDEALAEFNDFDKHKRNKQIRIIKVPPLDTLPKYLEDASDVFELKVFDDGSLVMARPYLSRMKSTADFISAYGEHKTEGRIESGRTPTETEARDLLFAWYVNIHVRSNGVVIARNGQTLAVGTGEQDRVGAVQQAIAKAQSKYQGSEILAGAVIASDGFFPFRDSIDVIAAAGVRAIVQPGGSVSDYDVVATCNEHKIAMVFTGERCFSHH